MSEDWVVRYEKRFFQLRGEWARQPRVKSWCVKGGTAASPIEYRGRALPYRGNCGTGRSEGRGAET